MKQPRPFRKFLQGVLYEAGARPMQSLYRSCSTSKWQSLMCLASTPARHAPPRSTKKPTPVQASGWI
jgi:hypothetical protein